MTAELKVDPGKYKNVASGGEIAQKGESMFLDAMRRLVRNRAAVIGGVIIIILILSAIFADWLAVKPFDDQILDDAECCSRVGGESFSHHGALRPIFRSLSVGGRLCGTRSVQPYSLRWSDFSARGLYWPDHQPADRLSLWRHFRVFWRQSGYRPDAHCGHHVCFPQSACLLSC